MGFNNKTATVVNDDDLLIENLDRIISGNFEKVNEKSFSNPLIAQKLNEMLNMFTSGNNNFVMMLNDSMREIGDSSCVKNMLEQLKSQTVGINEMRGASDEGRFHRKDRKGCQRYQGQCPWSYGFRRRNR